MKPEQYLFAYGTLRKDYSPDPVPGIRDKLIYVGEAEASGLMYDLGAYPGAVRGGESGMIRGDVFLIRDPEKVLGQLDEYEGISRSTGRKAKFAREKSPITWGSGDRSYAWIYWYNLEVTGKTRITSGDYLKYLEKEKST